MPASSPNRRICALITANAGALTFRIEVPGPGRPRQHPVRGASAHRRVPADPRGAGRARDAGATPIAEPLHDRTIPIAYPLSVGRIRAGDWSSSVPDLAGRRGPLRPADRGGPGDGPGRAGGRGAELRPARSLPPRPSAAWSAGPVASSAAGGCRPGIRLATGWPSAARTGDRLADIADRTGRPVRQRPAAVRAGRHPDAALRAGRRAPGPRARTSRCRSSSCSPPLRCSLGRCCRPISWRPVDQDALSRVPRRTPG